MTTPTETHRPERRLAVRIVGWLIVLAVFVVFMVENGRSVRITFLFWDATTRLSWALLVAGIFGLVLGLVLPRLRRVLRARSLRSERD